MKKIKRSIMDRADLLRHTVILHTLWYIQEEARKPKPTFGKYRFWWQVPCFAWCLGNVAVMADAIVAAFDRVEGRHSDLN